MKHSRRNRKPPRRPLTILYNRDSWLAISKPSGIAVHPGAGKASSPSIIERLHEEQGEKLHLMHRLDRGTAGVLLLARTADAAQKGAKEWDSVSKTYWAIALGEVAPQHIDQPLRAPDGRNQSAATTIEWSTTLNTYNNISTSLCRIRIQTGRFHQIRRHLAGLGHPILMDDRYGDFDLNKGFEADFHRQHQTRPKHPFLLCWRLSAPRSPILPSAITALWPRVWEIHLRTSGVSVDDLDRLA